MATFLTTAEVGLKEDVSDIITNISPRKTPFQSDIGSEKVTQPLFQWQEDSLRAVSVAPKAEGADAGNGINVVPTVMRQNYTQIFSEDVKVSGTVQASQAYGRAKELAYQMSKSASALKRDVEAAFLGGAASNVGANATRTTASAQAQIDAANKLPGTLASLEADMLKVMEAAYKSGAEPTRILIPTAVAASFAAFAQAAGRYRTFTDPKSNNIVNVVNLYVSPFGEQKVMIDRFIKDGDILLYDPEMFSTCTLRPWTRENLAKVGDSERMLLVGEHGLKHKNFLAAGLVTIPPVGP